MYHLTNQQLSKMSDWTTVSYKRERKVRDPNSDDNDGESRRSVDTSYLYTTLNNEPPTYSWTAKSSSTSSSAGQLKKVQSSTFSEYKLDKMEEKGEHLPTFSKGLGLLIQKARNNIHMMQTQLADAVAVTPAVIRDVETGKANFSSDLLRKINKVLKTRFKRNSH